LKELLLAYRWKIKRSGEHSIKIEKGKRRNQEILLVGAAEMHRPYSSSTHEEDSDQYHAEQQYDCQRTEAPLHRHAHRLLRVFKTFDRY
jgi:hypothetical protein